MPDDKTKQANEAFDRERSELAQRFERQKAERERLNQLEAAARESEKKERNTELRQEADQKWADVLKMGQEFFHNRQQGYDSFQSAMSSQFDFNLRISEALRAEVPGILSAVSDRVSYVTGVSNGPAPDALSEWIGTIPQKIKTNLTQPAPVQVDYYLECDDQNTVKVTNLKRCDGQAITPEQQLSFEADVVAFLQCYRYTADSDHPGQFKPIAPETRPLKEVFKQWLPLFTTYLSEGKAIRAKLDNEAARYEAPQPLPRP